MQKILLFYLPLDNHRHCCNHNMIHLHFLHLTMASDGNIFDTPQKNKHGKSLVSTNEKKVFVKIVDVSVYSINCIQSIVDGCFVVFIAIFVAIVIAFVVAIVAVCSITDKEETPSKR